MVDNDRGAIQKKLSKISGLIEMKTSLKCGVTKLFSVGEALFVLSGGRLYQIDEDGIETVVECSWV